MQKAARAENGINLEAKMDSARKDSAFWQRIALHGVLLVAVFFLGFVPAWLSGRETVRQRDAAQANLRVSQLQNRLATAVLSAGHGQYEPATKAASDFFNDLRAELERQNSGFNSKQMEAVKPVLEQRDEVITLLARSDAKAPERLTDLYLSYVQTVNSSLQKTRPDPY